MKKYIQDGTYEKAIALRRQGLSYGEIRRELGERVSLGTLSLWLRPFPLSHEQQAALKERVAEKQRGNGDMVREGKRRARERRRRLLLEKSRGEFELFVSEPLFTVGVALYWAHGSQKGPYFTFAHSDPASIQVMAQFVEEYIGVSRENIVFRLYEHAGERELERHKSAWANLLAIPPEQIRPPVYMRSWRGIRRNVLFMGSMRVEVRGKEAFEKMIRWRKMLAEYILTRQGHTPPW